MLNSKPSLSYKKNDFVGLEQLQETHIGLTFMARNLQHIRKWFLTSEPLTWENHLNWFNNYKEKLNDIVFIIFDETNNKKPVGQVALYDINYKDSVAEYGRCMVWDEEATGKGLLEKSTKILMDISKNELKINKWVLDVKSDNSKAIHVYKKLGFKDTSTNNDTIRMELVL